MNERLIGLIDTEKLSNFNILLVGVGGVGSACFEVLIRSGVKNITIVDFDTYEESNLNRQLHSNMEVIGKKKIDVLKKFANTLPLDINVNSVDVYLDSSSSLDFSNYDYIIDACDTVDTKVLLIKECLDRNIKIISSMGTGNKFNPSKLEIIDISKTSYDPLAKILRKKLKDIGIKHVMVVSSTEEPINIKELGSNSIVPNTAGILCASYVINDITKK